MTAAELLARNSSKGIRFKVDDLEAWLHGLAAQGWLAETQDGFHVTDAGWHRFQGLIEGDHYEMAA